MTRGLIIGFGNTLRADDGFGIRTAEELRSAINADVITTHQLHVEHVDAVSRAAWVVFIDAREDDTTAPGTIREERIGAEAETSGAFSHHLTPEQLMACAEVLFCAAPPAWLISVVGKSFELKEGLSAEVEAALPGVTERVRAIANSKAAAEGA